MSAARPRRTPVVTWADFGAAVEAGATPTATLSATSTATPSATRRLMRGTDGRAGWSRCRPAIRCPRSGAGRRSRASLSLGRARAHRAARPNHPADGVGTLARIRTSDGPDGDVVFERSAERPMGLWTEAGEELLRIVPLLGPDAPPADDLEGCRLCPGCYRPVYESSSSHTLIGAGPMPVIGLCRLCAEGTSFARCTRWTSRSTRSSAPSLRPWPPPWRSRVPPTGPDVGQPPWGETCPASRAPSAASGFGVALAAPVRVVDADLVPGLALLEPGQGVATPCGPNPADCWR
ncbi:hypothetical protein FBY22_4008 [Streptomyces sp. SLBN-31]|nr:hypothetical protein FBY22_4008 [Streptomyces sp. SLBN-31]